MNAEDIKHAVLNELWDQTYVTADFHDRETSYSLTTIFEHLTHLPGWRSPSFDDFDDTDDKEAVRTVLDQMTLDGLLEAQMDERDYERNYRITNQGIYEQTSFDQLAVDEGLGDAEQTDRSVTIDSSAWTGLTKVVIDARNAKVISGLIDKALTSLPGSEAGNFQIMQATAYLRAAKELVDAPEPPSQEIWRLIGRAADIVGLFGLFYTIFAQAMK